MAGKLNPIFKTKFRKYFKTRITAHRNLVKRFEQRYRLFLEDQNNPILLDHPLTGKLKGYRAFSVTGDIRVVYYIKNNTALL